MSFSGIISFAKAHKKEGSVLFLLYLLYIVLAPRTGHEFDTSCWQNWSVFAWEHGLGNVYQSGTDYPPVQLYILYLFGLLQGSEEHIRKYIFELKYFTLLFDFAGALLCLRFLKNKEDHLLGLMVVLLNVAFIYNTLIWGQVDSMFSFFAFAAIIAAWRNNIYLSGALYTIALLCKVQAIVFLPLWGLILLWNNVQPFSFLRLGKFLAVCLLVAALLLAPFMGDMERLQAAFFGSVGRYPYISLNAYNLWYILMPDSGDLRWLSDQDSLLGLSYKNWGLLFFFISSGLVLLPIAIKVYKKVFGKAGVSISIEQLLLSGALISLLFFFMNTQMHERYSHPAFLFIIAAAFSTRNYWPYALFSIAYFLNMEDVYMFLNLPNYNTFLFDPSLAAAIFLLVIVLLSYQLYRVTFSKAEKGLLPE